MLVISTLVQQVRCGSVLSRLKYDPSSEGRINLEKAYLWIEGDVNRAYYKYSVVFVALKLHRNI